MSKFPTFPHAYSGDLGLFNYSIEFSCFEAVA